MTSGPSVPGNQRTANRQKDSQNRDGWVSKLSSAWNELRYSWYVKVGSSFSDDQPVWLLGKSYSKDQNFSDTEDSNADCDWLTAFHQDFQSLFWFTYRKGFSPLPGSTLTNDCGWGCMLRSGQMLFAEILSRHFKSSNDASILLKWFTDDPYQPFSIHKMVSLATSVGKYAGDWYGPTSIAHILSSCLNKAQRTSANFKNLKMYVAPDCSVHIQDLIALLTDEQDSTQIAEEFFNSNRKITAGFIENLENWKSLIIIFPMRLGGESFNMSYQSLITGVLSMPSCVGIIGGRPKHSLYFVGYQGDKLIYLDPHYCQEAIPGTIRSETYHCSCPKKVSCKKMDPSCAIGFYLNSKQDLLDFIDEMKKLQHLSVFEIVETFSESDLPVKYMIPEERYLDFTRRYVTEDGDIIERVTSEEFVFI